MSAGQPLGRLSAIASMSPHFIKFHSPFFVLPCVSVPPQQDRHFRKNGLADPAIDPSQDCTLLLGYENRTHTVLRFRRPLSNDCDPAHDMPITAGTQSVFYYMNAREPANGSLAPGSLPAPDRSFSRLIPMQLLQRTDGPAWRHRDAAAAAADVVDLRNGPMNLPMAGEALLWCRLFELGQFAQKHHIVRYEPLFDTAASHLLMAEIVLYECQGPDAERLAQLAAEGGHLCVAQRARPTLPCNAIVATWRTGSTVSCVAEERHLSSRTRAVRD